jgi:transposase
LRQFWVQNDFQTGENIRWRTDVEGIPHSARFVSSAYDPDAHYGRRYTYSWIGYKIHLTETCEDNLPNLITNVETTAATTADGVVTPRAHQSLQQRGLLPLCTWCTPDFSMPNSWWKAGGAADWSCSGRRAVTNVAG